MVNASRKQNMQTSVSWYLYQTLPQLLGISASAAQPEERCYFQGLFSNICDISTHVDAGSYREIRLHLRLHLPSELHRQCCSAGTQRCPAPKWHFARETLCNVPHFTKQGPKTCGNEAVCSADRQEGSWKRMRECEVGKYLYFRNLLSFIKTSDHSLYQIIKERLGRMWLHCLVRQEPFRADVR